MKLLSIGNSFSEDAQRYFSGVAEACGVSVGCVNLMIGGCSLQRHHRNMISGQSEYLLQRNGGSTDVRVSLEAGLCSDSWDVVTLQQVSQESPRFDTYTPYLEELAAFVRRCQPKAGLVIHETWAYEDGSQRLTAELGYRRSSDMLCDIKAAYEKAATAIAADGIIRSGEMMQRLLAGGISRIHRDTFHADLGVGRYALACLWVRTLCGVRVSGNGFRRLDAPVSDEERAIIERTVDKFDCIL